MTKRKRKRTHTQHYSLSTTKEKPFVVINSGIAENLIESELFGYKAGAFTMQKKINPLNYKGEGGTLFFDENGECRYQCRLKLLDFFNLKNMNHWVMPIKKKAFVRIIRPPIKIYVRK
jgi:transcriptional regulator with PAS, ATPase and Fis domain